MALGSTAVPPWLNIGPTDYLHAIQAGTQAGLEVNRQRALAEEAAARRELAQQEAQRQAWEFGETMRQRAQLAAAENERQREYNQGMLNWHREQMRLDAEKAAETARHNVANEAIDFDRAQAMVRNGQAQIVTHPEAPDYLFLRNPSGSEAVIKRPEKGLSESDKMGYTFRAFNALEPKAMTDETSPMWQAKTNYASKVLSDLGVVPKQDTTLDLSPVAPLDVSGSGIPSVPTLAPFNLTMPTLPSEGTSRQANEVIRYTKDGRKAVFDADTKEFIRYAE